MPVCHFLFSNQNIVYFVKAIGGIWLNHILSGIQVDEIVCDEENHMQKHTSHCLRIKGIIIFRDVPLFLHKQTPKIPFNLDTTLYLGHNTPE